MKMPCIQIPPSKPNIRQKDLDAVKEVLESGMIASGEQVRLFEDEMSAYVGLRGGIATSSGTSAIHLALNALGIGQGDEVIIPTYVCASVFSAVNYTGAKPVLADVELNGFNISPESIAHKISKRTRCILVPHMFGSPARIKEILEIAGESGIRIIEDCAQSIGSLIGGRKLGSFGDMAVCSFYATKVFTTGQGGMVLTGSHELLEKCRDLMKYDGRANYKVSYNYSLTDFQAALGRSQLKDLNEFIKRRREIAGIYDDVFYDLGVRPMRPKDSIYFRYISDTSDLDAYILKARKLGLFCGKPVFKPLHYYKEIQSSFGEDFKGFPNSDRAYGRLLFIPDYPAMSDEMVEYACGIIKTLWTA